MKKKFMEKSNPIKSLKMLVFSVVVAMIIPISASAATYTVTSPTGFEMDGTKYVLSERFSDEEIPSGFSKKELTFGQAKYTELSNGSITLVYVKKEANKEGKGTFYIYDESANTVEPLYILGSGDSRIIVFSSEESEAATYLETVYVESNGEMIEGYGLPNDDQYAYIYGLDSSDAFGWFKYDSTSGTIEKADIDAVIAQVKESETETVDAPEPADISENTTEGIDYKKRYEILLYVTIALAVLLIISFIAFLNVLSTKRAYEEELEDDEEEEEEEIPLSRKERKALKREQKEFNKRDFWADPEEDEDSDEDEPDADSQDDDIDLDLEIPVITEFMEKKTKDVVDIKLENTAKEPVIQSTPAPKVEQLPDIDILDLNDL